MGGTRYQVRVGDNFHLFDESQIYTHRTFDDPDAAVAACKRMVEEDLEASHGTGMTAADLLHRWAAFGDSPFIVASDGSPVPFSAWEYAAQRSAALTK